MLAHIKIYFVLLSLFGLSNFVVAGNGGHQAYPEKLLDSDRFVGDFGVGVTTLETVKKQFGGTLVKDRGNVEKALVSHVCLVIFDDSNSYKLTLNSSALGGWDVVTGYRVEVIPTGSNTSNCGSYEKKNISFSWKAFQKDDVIKIYGHPNYESLNKFEYKYKHTIIDSKSNTQIQVYSGLIFYFDADGRVARFDVFETKST